jgi:diamine N-acetyltransferase
MTTIQEAIISDIKTIQEIAHISWAVTYGPILSAIQLEYMLDLIYSDDSLLQQFQKKQQIFYLIVDQNVSVGFFSIEHQYKNENVTRIHKIYLLPETQGKGFGKFAIDKITEIALEKNAKKLSLNVNRFNNAIHFYQKIGFETIGEEDIEIGNGYLMEDFMLEKKI